MITIFRQIILKYGIGWCRCRDRINLWLKSVFNKIDTIGMSKIDEVLSANNGVESTKFLIEFFLGEC